MPGAPAWHRWKEVLPALRLARGALDLNRGRLELLEKLMACLPLDHLALPPAGELIVHVSNARLAEMMNRDSDKTVTRLITEVEARGLIRRKPSPNGKRYARRNADGTVVAYGLDLAPLLRKMPEIDTLAARARQIEDARRQMHEECSLALSTLAEQRHGTAISSEDIDDARRALRRKSSPAELTQLLAKLRQHMLPPESTGAADAGTTAKMRAAAPQNACHKDSDQNQDGNRGQHSQSPDRQPEPTAALTPELVEAHMPRVAGLGRALKGNLHDLVERMRLMLGIQQQHWRRSVDMFGYQEAALLLMMLYERQDIIRNPTAYLHRILAAETKGATPGSRLLHRTVRACARC